jgi:type I restriction enzyme S subunit
VNKTWEYRSLEELCEFGSGLWKGKKPPYIKASVIRNTNFTKDCELSDSDIIKLDVEISQFEKRKLKFEDLVIEKSGGGPKQPVGRVVLFNIKNGNYSLSNFTSFLRIKDKQILNSKYLHKFLYFIYVSGITETMQSHSTGIRNLNLHQYKRIQVPIPPLSEQKQIVSILDEAFEGIAKAKANAEKNLANAREIFESYLQDLFVNKKSGWKEAKLNDLCEKITKGSSPKWQGIKYVGEPGILFVTSENVGVNRMILNTKKYVEERFNLLEKKAILKRGDVLTNIVGASIGRTAIFECDDIANINQAVCILRCKTDLLYNRFLSYLLNSPFLKAHLHENEVNNARANLSLGFFSNLKLNIPTLKEQKTIVSRIDEFAESIEKLETVYLRKLNDLQDLKKSILQKAFSGDLIRRAS